MFDVEAAAKLSSPEMRARVARAICHQPGSLCRGFCHMRRCPTAIDRHGADADAALAEITAALTEE